MYVTSVGLRTELQEEDQEEKKVLHMHRVDLMCVTLTRATERFVTENICRLVSDRPCHDTSLCGLTVEDNFFRKPPTEQENSWHGSMKQVTFSPV